MKIRNLFSLSVALLFTASVAFAQVAPGPTNLANAPLGTLITNTAQGAGTVNSASQNNLYHKGAVCTFYTASQTGTPSSTFAIQMWDRVSNTWQSLVVSGAITAATTPTTIIVYPGIAATGPTGYVGFNGRLTRVWRVSETVGGTTPAVTGTVSCELLP